MGVLPHKLRAQQQTERTCTQRAVVLPLHGVVLPLRAVVLPLRSVVLPLHGVVLCGLRRRVWPPILLILQTPSEHAMPIDQLTD